MTQICQNGPKMTQNDPKISTGQEKLAPTGWHGWHVFATLILACELVKLEKLMINEPDEPKDSAQT